MSAAATPIDEVLELAEVRALVASGEARRIREAARLGVAEMGRAVGVSHTVILRWEANERTPRGEPALRYGRLLAALRAATEARS